MKKKGLILLGILCGVSVALHFFIPRPQPPVSLSPPLASQSHKKISPAATPTMAKPVRLVIPSLKIEGPVVEVGITPEGNMDTPKQNTEVGWYKYGAAPGNKGSAVLAAHTGYPSEPSPFRVIERLKIGDDIEVIDTNNTTAKFKVTEALSYPTAKSPRERIFGHTTKNQLVLITCSGVWLPRENTYSHRLVIYGTRV